MAYTATVTQVVGAPRRYQSSCMSESKANNELNDSHDSLITLDPRGCRIVLSTETALIGRLPRNTRSRFKSHQRAIYSALLFMRSLSDVRPMTRIYLGVWLIRKHSVYVVTPLA